MSVIIDLQCLSFSLRLRKSWRRASGVARKGPSAWKKSSGEKAKEILDKEEKEQLN